MTQRAKTSDGRRSQRSARKLDRKKVLDLHQRGLSNSEIAKHEGVATTTVWRFLQQTEPERRDLERFKQGRADVLARLQAKSLDAQERILDTLKDGVLDALKPQEKNGLMLALNAQHGTCFDKERLERGQSTSNQSIVSSMIDSTVKDLYKPNPRRKDDRMVRQ